MPIPEELLPRTPKKEEPSKQEGGVDVGKEKPAISRPPAGEAGKPYAVSEEGKEENDEKLKAYSLGLKAEKKPFQWRLITTRILPIFLFVLLAATISIAAVPSWRASFNKFIAKFSPQASELAACETPKPYLFNMDAYPDWLDIKVNGKGKEISGDKVYAPFAITNIDENITFSFTNGRAIECSYSTGCTSLFETDRVEKTGMVRVNADLRVKFNYQGYLVEGKDNTVTDKKVLVDYTITSRDRTLLRGRRPNERSDSSISLSTIESNIDYYKNWIFSGIEWYGTTDTRCAWCNESSGKVSKENPNPMESIKNRNLCYSDALKEGGGGITFVPDTVLSDCNKCGSGGGWFASGQELNATINPKYSSPGWESVKYKMYYKQNMTYDNFNGCPGYTVDYSTDAFYYVKGNSFNLTVKPEKDEVAMIIKKDDKGDVVKDESGNPVMEGKGKLIVETTENATNKPISAHLTLKSLDDKAMFDFGGVKYTTLAAQTDGNGHFETSVVSTKAGTFNFTVDAILNSLCASASAKIKFTGINLGVDIKEENPGFDQNQPESETNIKNWQYSSDYLQVPVSKKAVPATQDTPEQKEIINQAKAIITLKDGETSLPGEKVDIYFISEEEGEAGKDITDKVTIDGKGLLTSSGDADKGTINLKLNSFEELKGKIKAVYTKDDTKFENQRNIEKGIEFKGAEAPEVAIDSICQPKEKTTAQNIKKDNKIISFFKKLIAKILHKNMAKAVDLEMECISYEKDKKDEYKFFPDHTEAKYRISLDQFKTKDRLLTVELPKLEGKDVINYDYLKTHCDNCKYDSDKKTISWTIKKNEPTVEVPSASDPNKKEQKNARMFTLKIIKNIPYDFKKLEILEDNIYYQKLDDKGNPEEQKIKITERVELDVWAKIKGLLTGPYPGSDGALRIIPNATLALFDSDNVKIAGALPGSDDYNDENAVLSSDTIKKDDSDKIEYNYTLDFNKNELDKSGGSFRVGVYYYSKVKDKPPLKFLFQDDSLVYFKTVPVPAKDYYDKTKPIINLNIKTLGDGNKPDPEWGFPEQVSQYDMKVNNGEISAVNQVQVMADIWINLQGAYAKSEELTGTKLTDQVVAKIKPDFTEQKFMFDKDSKDDNANSGSYLAENNIYLNYDSLNPNDWQRRFPFEEYHQLGHIIIEKMFPGGMQNDTGLDNAEIGVKNNMELGNKFPNKYINYSHGNYNNDLAIDSMLEALCHNISSEFYNKINEAKDPRIYTPSGTVNGEEKELTDLSIPAAIYSAIDKIPVFDKENVNETGMESKKFDPVKTEEYAIAGLIYSLLHGTKVYNSSALNTYINQIELMQTDGKYKKFDYDLQYLPDKDDLNLKNLLTRIKENKLLLPTDLFEYLNCTWQVGKKEYILKTGLSNITEIKVGSALEQLFILHGIYKDTNGNRKYDWAEPGMPFYPQTKNGITGNVGAFKAKIPSASGGEEETTFLRRDWRN